MDRVRKMQSFLAEDCETGNDGVVLTLRKVFALEGTPRFVFAADGHEAILRGNEYAIPSSPFRFKLGMSYVVQTGLTLKKPAFASFSLTPEMSKVFSLSNSFEYRPIGEITLVLFCIRAQVDVAKGFPFGRMQIYVDSKKKEGE